MEEDDDTSSKNPFELLNEVPQNENTCSAGKCIFCLQVISKDTEWIVEAPCCSSSINLQCMTLTVFMPTKREIYCPVCTNPKKEKKEWSTSHTSKKYIREKNPASSSELWGSFSAFLDNTYKSNLETKKKYLKLLKKNS